MNEDHATPTRLSEPATTVRLARVGADGSLQPRRAGNVNEAKAWSLSEVRLASRLVPMGSEPAAPWTAAAEAVAATWPKYERDKVLAVMEGVDKGVSASSALVDEDGRQIVIRYSTISGVAFE